MFSWGANSYGQLGLGNCDDKHTPEKVSQIPEKVISIHGGGGHSVLVSESGDVFVCGWNSKGQLGVNHTDNLTVFQQVSGLPPVKKLSCGWDFTVALTENNKVYAWGSNAYGQLGIPEVQKYVCVPQAVKALQGLVVDVKAGLRHSVAITVDGAVWSWGSGRKGQLGVTDDTGTGCPALQMLPTKVPNIQNAKLVETGSYHTVCLTGDGELYVWGDNNHKQLTDSICGVSQKSGSGQKEIVLTPQKVNMELFDCQRIQQIHCGWTHTVAVTDSRRIYSWGRCDYGQLGAAPSSMCHDGQPVKCRGQPMEIASLRGVVKQMICGAEHNLARTDDGRVLAWGWNEHGMCGDGSEVNVNEPKLIEVLSKRKITLLGSGAGHCFALGENR